MVIGGCCMAYAVGNYMIPCSTELGAFCVVSISLGFVLVGVAGIISQVYDEIRLNIFLNRK